MSENDFPIEPIGDIIIVEQLTEEKTAGGIVLTGDHKKFPCGRVVACGPGRVYTTYLDASGHHLAGQVVPVSVKVGDYVIFGKYNSGGEPIEIKGKKYLMCREGDIGGISRIGSDLRVRLAVD
jgi:co-chaperonin GroES (HSP10)